MRKPDPRFMGGLTASVAQDFDGSGKAKAGMRDKEFPLLEVPRPDRGMRMRKLRYPPPGAVFGKECGIA